jgi:hypothetical protein
MYCSSESEAHFGCCRALPAVLCWVRRAECRFNQPESCETRRFASPIGRSHLFAKNADYVYDLSLTATELDTPQSIDLPTYSIVISRHGNGIRVTEVRRVHATVVPGFIVSARGSYSPDIFVPQDRPSKRMLHVRSTPQQVQPS